MADVKWISIGGDLEARYDGGSYVDIRAVEKHPAIFMSETALKNALKLIQKTKAEDPDRSRPAKG